MIITGLTFLYLFKKAKKTKEQITVDYQQHFSDDFMTQTQTKKASDKDVIEVAVANQGKVTATILVMRLGISIDEANQKLESLHNKGIFTLENMASGHLVYELVDMDLMR